jgi:uncharacterized protein (TIGR03435 family)
LTLDELAGLLGGLDRPVVNKTGITALVSYRFEYPREGSQDSIVAALKDQLGLELRPAKGPREFLVIDHLERPVPDDAIQSTQKLDVVSVRPCDQNAPSSGRGSNTGTASPGRIRLDCQSLFMLIGTAYVSFPNGRVSSPGERLDFHPWSASVPDWAMKERFTIEAKADGDPPPNVLRGPMLQAILEDRFNLKVHVETRIVPVDELVIAKGGSKLTPFQPGTCVPYDYTAYPQPPLASGQRRCQSTTLSSDEANGSWVDSAEGTTLDVDGGFNA